MKRRRLLNRCRLPAYQARPTLRLAFQFSIGRRFNCWALRRSVGSTYFAENSTIRRHLWKLFHCTTFEETYISRHQQCEVKLWWCSKTGYMNVSDPEACSYQLDAMSPICRRNSVVVAWQPFLFKRSHIWRPCWSLLARHLRESKYMGKNLSHFFPVKTDKLIKRFLSLLHFLQDAHNRLTTQFDI